MDEAALIDLIVHAPNVYEFRMMDMCGSIILLQQVNKSLVNSILNPVFFPFIPNVCSP